MTPSSSTLDNQVLAGSDGAKLGLSAVPARTGRVLRMPRRRGMRGVGDGDGLDVWGDTNPGGPIDAQFPTSTFPSVTAPVNWGGILATGEKGLFDILKLQLTPPTLIQTPQGLIYRAPAGGSASPGLFAAGVPGSSLFGGSNMLPWLIGGAVVLFGVMALGRR